MFKKSIFILTLMLAGILGLNAQVVDIIITKDGKSLYGKILENKKESITYIEKSTNKEREVEKSIVEEVILGYKIEDLSEELQQNVNLREGAQDYILRTNGDRLTVMILDVSKDKILYRYLDDDPDMEREMDRALVKEIHQQGTDRLDNMYETTSENIEADYAEEMDLQSKYMEEVVYTQNRMNALKFNFTALGLGSLSLSYEKSLGRNKSFEVVASSHGTGVSNDNSHKNGFGGEVGFKFKMGNIFSEYYLPDHLLSGTYIKPILGFGSVNERQETYSFGNSFVFRNKNRNYGYLGFDLGYQWVFGDLVLMDIYSGMAYYNGEFEITTNDNGEIRVTNEDFFDEGDFFGSDKFGAKAGFKIGILFGSKTKYQSK